MLLYHHPRSVNALAFTPDGELFTGDASGRVRAWNRVTGEASVVLREMSPFRSMPISGLSVSRDGEWLAVGCDCQPGVLRAVNLCRIGPLPPPSEQPKLTCTEP